MTKKQHIFSCKRRIATKLDSVVTYEKSSSFSSKPITKKHGRVMAYSNGLLSTKLHDISIIKLPVWLNIGHHSQSHMTLWSHRHMRLHGKWKTLYIIFQDLLPPNLWGGQFWWEAIICKVTWLIGHMTHDSSTNKFKWLWAKKVVWGPVIQLNFYKACYQQIWQASDL